MAVTLSMSNILKNIITVPKVVDQLDFYGFTALRQQHMGGNFFIAPSYDYAGAHNAINPGLCNCSWTTTICFYNNQPLNRLDFRCIEFM